MTDAEMVKLAQVLKEARESFAHTLELIRYDADIKRAKYLALLKAGFSESQAIELCKSS